MSREAREILAKPGVQYLSTVEMSKFCSPDSEGCNNSENTAILEGKLDPELSDLN